MAETSEPTDRTSWTERTGRIPISDVFPLVDGGAFPAKGYVGEVIPFGATVFREGHDLVGARLELTAPDGNVRSLALTETASGSDLFTRLAQVDVQGMWTYRIHAYADDYATWEHAASLKIPAGVDVDLMLTIGAGHFTRAAAQKARPKADRALFSEIAAMLADPREDALTRLARATADDVDLAFGRLPLGSLDTYSAPAQLLVERRLAGVGSWYEFFPRSIGAKKLANGTWKSGTFRTAAQRLPAIAEQGYDVIYLPPIHPIGRSFRKGKNNTLDATADDPGSPWAIGSEAGGHDAIHPDLGKTADFVAFVRTATKVGLEVALDFALQASPDHPWVQTHPEWFTTLPDGSIAFAENPPKKYQDIYPINFDNDPEGIRAEALRILEHWIGLGVRIFRVDNPHTKPSAFWEWLIHTVNERHPDVIFLAEAFTRPAPMYTLAKVGFQQSYSYFTWRNTKEELEEFFTTISTETAEFLRPNLFVNTPDILTAYLQFGGVPAYKIRAVLAAMGAPLWGVYSGYELIENVARPGAEENIDNEKYEYKARDFAAAEADGRSIAGYLATLNRIRREHPALQQLRNLSIQFSDDDSILVFSKYLSAEFTGTGRPDAIIVVVNVDPHSARETNVYLDPTTFGLPPDAVFEVTDLLSGNTWKWSATSNYVRLDSFLEPAHILEVHYPDPTE